MQRDVRSVEDAQEGVLGGEQAAEKLVECGETGHPSVEDAIEAGAQAMAFGRIDQACRGIAFERPVEFPNLLTLAFDRPALRRRCAGQLLDLSLSRNPAPRMVADRELRRAIADNDDVVEEALLDDGSPQRAFAGLLPMTGTPMPKFRQVTLPTQTGCYPDMSIIQHSRKCPSSNNVASPS